MTAEEHIQDFQDFLKRSGNALKLIDHETNEVLDDQLTSEKLMRDHSNDLKQALRHHIPDDQTSRSVVVQKRKQKNGHFINVGDKVKLDINIKRAEPVRSGGGWPASAGPSAVNTQPMQQYQPQPQPQPQPQQGMNGNTAQLLADSERYKDYKRWYEEAAKDLKEKKEELEKVKDSWKEKYDKLKEDFNDYKFDQRMEDKPGTIEKLVDTITQKPELLAGIMQALPQNVKQNQLGQGQGMQGANELDPQSKEIASAINNLSDSDTEKIVQVVNHYFLGTENFIPDFEKVLEQHREELEKKFNENEQQHQQERSA